MVKLQHKRTVARQEFINPDIFVIIGARQGTPFPIRKGGPVSVTIPIPKYTIPYRIGYTGSRDSASTSQNNSAFSLEQLPVPLLIVSFSICSLLLSISLPRGVVLVACLYLIPNRHRHLISLHCRMIHRPHLSSLCSTSFLFFSPALQGRSLTDFTLLVRPSCFCCLFGRF